jgi:glutathione peroxidase
MDIYDLKVRDIYMREIPLSDYKGKVMLIVNTATGCGFTPQYEGLETLYAKYRDQGFEILDFPCNQFMQQAPGTNEEIASFCAVKFGTKFKTFARIDVNGKDADPLFVHLRANAPASADGGRPGLVQKLVGKLSGDDSENRIQWNFTKFLVDRDGTIVARFEPKETPESIEPHIAKLLGA